MFYAMLKHLIEDLTIDLFVSRNQIYKKNKFVYNFDQNKIAIVFVKKDGFFLPLQILKTRAE